jgi:hypothetical protein
MFVTSITPAQTPHVSIYHILVFRISVCLNTPATDPFPVHVTLQFPGQSSLLCICESVYFSSQFAMCNLANIGKQARATKQTVLINLCLQHTDVTTTDFKTLATQENKHKNNYTKKYKNCLESFVIFTQVILCGYCL